MLFDSHVHTKFSADSEMLAQEALKSAEQIGLGLVFTEHLDADYTSKEGKVFSFDPEAHHAYVERIFRRFQNPHLKDEVQRVGREPFRKLAPGDRLIKPLVTTAGYGLPGDHMIFGAAAALRFDCPDDPQSVEMLKTIAEKGAEAVLLEHTGLEAGNPLLGRILDVYRALAVAKK